MVNNYSQNLVVFHVVSESPSWDHGNKIVLLDLPSDERGRLPLLHLRVPFSWWGVCVCACVRACTRVHTYALIHGQGVCPGPFSWLGPSPGEASLHFHCCIENNLVFFVTWNMRLEVASNSRLLLRVIPKVCGSNHTLFRSGFNEEEMTMDSIRSEELRSSKEK